MSPAALTVRKHVMACRPETHGATCSAGNAGYNTLDGIQTSRCKRPAVWHMTAPRFGHGYACSHVCKRHGRIYSRGGDILLTALTTAK